jgi:hypothetical protein
MSADASLKIVKCAFSPVSVWKRCGRNNLSWFQCDIAVLRFAFWADLLKNTVVFANDIARNTDVLNVLFHENTPTLISRDYTREVQKFR